MSTLEFFGFLPVYNKQRHRLIGHLNLITYQSKSRILFWALLLSLIGAYFFLWGFVALFITFVLLAVDFVLRQKYAAINDLRRDIIWQQVADDCGEAFSEAIEEVLDECFVIADKVWRKFSAAPTKTPTLSVYKPKGFP